MHILDRRQAFSIAIQLEGFMSTTKLGSVRRWAQGGILQKDHRGVSRHKAALKGRERQWHFVCNRCRGARGLVST